MRKLTLAQAIILAVLTVQTLVYSGIATFSFLVSKDSLAASRQQHIQVAYDRLENTLPSLLWNFNDEAINEHLHIETNNVVIKAILIQVDGENSYAFYAPFEKEPTTTLPQKIIDELLSLDKVELHYRGSDGIGLVGELYILDDNSQDNKKLKSLINFLVFLAVALDISLAVLIYMFMYFLVLNPINKINKGLVKIGAHNGDLSLRLKENHIGELGELSKNYNAVANYTSEIIKSSNFQRVNFQAIFNNAIDGIIVFDENGNIGNVNSAACNIFGHASLINDSIKKILLKDYANLIINNIRNYDHSKGNFIIGNTIEFIGIKKDGSEFPLSVSLSSINELDKPTFIALVRDISGEKGANYEREEALQKAKESANLKSEFLASMSHEIRTPMNGVLGMLSLLIKGELNEQQRHYSKLAKSSAESLLTLINDILDFSKIEAGKLELELLEFDLCKQLGEFSEAIAMRAQEKGLELILDTSNIDESVVKGDPGRLRQILTNLVGNAIKFTNEGEVSVHASLTPIENEKLRFICSIKDSGIGIPKDKQATLFDSFSQVDASTTREYGGTGLGLAIVAQLVELMNGNLSVESETNQGSTFTFEVILQKSAHSYSTKPEFSLKDQHILIVDDHKTALNAINQQLKKWGAITTPLNSGRIAIQALKEKTITAAYIAMHMHDMTGVQLCKFIQKQYPNVKTIMMTSIVDRGDRALFKQIGVQTFFPKPATTDDILSALEVVVLNKPSANMNNTTIEPTQANNTMARKKVLLVEDNWTNQEIALANLEGYGLEVQVANNGLEALEALKAQSKPKEFSMIFMDCLMPEMDGYQATGAIRAGKTNTELNTNDHIPIIAMTANAMKGDKEKCIASGMDDYLSKPLDASVLEDIIKNWINHH